MITIRKADERGKTEIGWLHSRHTFSFGEYFDPKFTRFRSLRVINDDIVEPGMGFGAHPHRDMEIITVVLEGALEHKDSLGHGEVLRPGEVQVMTAGRGIRHSEFNPSKVQRVRLLQVWIDPAQRGLEPAYAQKAFPRTERINRLRRVAGRSGPADDALNIHQDADLYLAAVGAGAKVEHHVSRGRAVWVQVATGSMFLNAHAMNAGDGAAVEDEEGIRLEGVGEDSEALVFDLV